MDETLEEDLGISKELIEQCKEALDTFKKPDHPPGDASDKTVKCPYCGGELSLAGRASYCRHCGKEIAQFLACAELLLPLLAQTPSKAGTIAKPETVEPLPVEPPLAFRDSIKAYLWPVGVPTFLFVSVSYLAWWGTSLKGTSAAIVATVLAVFLAALSVGLEHGRIVRDHAGKRFLLPLFAILFGIWIYFVQSLLQHYVGGYELAWPEERLDYLDLINTILGVLFAYLAGSSFRLHEAIVEGAGSWVERALVAVWRSRFSIVTSVISLLTIFFKFK